MSQREAILLWAVKSSFSRYIARMPDGVIEIAGEVRPVGHGRFAFSGQLTTADDTIVWRSTSGISYLGHGGLLAVHLNEPGIVIIGDTGSFTVATPGVPDARIAIADLLVVARSAGGSFSLEPHLSPNGARMFGNQYPAGQIFDPMTLLLQGDTDPVPSPIQIQDLREAPQT
ncbi:HtaA domain-containing protein [Herbiconiux ginsengi]|uniref:Htaa protein n=1 Tax=Herbiconiux ginsengi TaxID=381665 RepID=A0A1H3TEB1_9MICO|nr:HtaA domain-containing protein [Herbiconiux ginsengi]SDZ48161.1 Htaa protein [Herbiconiux ginsengi]